MKRYLGLSLAVLPAVLLFVYLTAYGLSPGGACDNGFGPAQRAKEEKFLRHMFLRERLPEVLEVDSFSRFDAGVTLTLGSSLPFLLRPLGDQAADMAC